MNTEKQDSRKSVFRRASNKLMKSRVFKKKVAIRQLVPGNGFGLQKLICLPLQAWSINSDEPKVCQDICNNNFYDYEIISTSNVKVLFCPLKKLVAMMKVDPTLEFEIRSRYEDTAHSANTHLRQSQFDSCREDSGEKSSIITAKGTLKIASLPLEIYRNQENSRHPLNSRQTRNNGQKNDGAMSFFAQSTESMRTNIFQKRVMDAQTKWHEKHYTQENRMMFEQKLKFTYFAPSGSRYKLHTSHQNHNPQPLLRKSLVNLNTKHQSSHIQLSGSQSQFGLKRDTSTVLKDSIMSKYRRIFKVQKRL